MAIPYSGELSTEKEPINFGTITIPVIKGDAGEGRNLEFIWQGTSLGVKLEGEETYQFVDLKGEQGIQGEQGVQGIQGIQGQTGKAFSVYKTYSSIEEMNADTDNVEEGNFVLIASTVNEEDNAKMFVKAQNEFIFLTDLSGAQGIQGEQGEQGIQGPIGNDGKSAYEVAVKNGYAGTEQQWLSSLKGYSYNRIVDFFTTTTENETTFELSKYGENCFLDVFVNGFLRPASQYSIQNTDDKYYVVFNNALNKTGTEIQINITEIVNGDSEWEIIKELTLEEESKSIAIDFENGYKEIDVRFNFEASSSEATRPGELMFRINDAKTYGTGIGVNVSTYVHLVLKSIVKAGRIFSFIEHASSTSSMPQIATTNSKEFSGYIEAESINRFGIYAYAGMITAGSKITIYGRK